MKPVVEGFLEAFSYVSTFPFSFRISPLCCVCTNAWGLEVVSYSLKDT
jgi:hypothetical protein